MNIFYITVPSLSSTLPLLESCGSCCVWAVESCDGGYITTYQLKTVLDEDEVLDFMQDNNIDYLCVEL